MSSATGGLKELHQVHLDLEACHKQLESGPRRIAACERTAARKQAEIAAQKALITDLQKNADQKNLQFRTNEQHIEDLRTKLNQANSNKEFDIFKKQIEADTQANSGLEDAYLELLELVDAAKARLQELEVELTEIDVSVKNIKDEFKALEPKVKIQAAKLDVELRAAEKCIPQKMTEMYRRLIIAHGASSLAPLDAGACSECFVELSPQNIVEVRSAQIVICKSCGRLLYSADSE
ncbi:MAG: C4-type zinc ribbon domain-containing protein [Planctomycetota bacterium]|nr:C4-type zinc ribbon domain-containing protein [Planctomycetota bacterium]